MFLTNNGQKGPQVEILRPGTYRINTKVFTIRVLNIVKISQEQIGVVVAQDGRPLPPGYIIAPKPTEQYNHNFFQNGQAFIQAGGYRGPQLDTLQPGEYYINPLLFRIILYPIAEVPPGYVAVIRSNIGLEIGTDSRTATPKPTDRKPTLEQSIHEQEEVVLTMDRTQRGILKEPIAPGKYNMNPLALDAYPVSTSAVTIDWAAGTDLRAEHKIIGDTKKLQTLVGSRSIVSTTEVEETDKAKEFFRFSQLRVTSKDGFQMEVDVRMIIRIRPQNAPFVIARFGSVSNLIEQIVHPLIDSSFRNKAGEKKAIDFIMSRTDLQKEALEKAQEEFAKYHVEAQNLLIAYISLDQNLLKTQTDKEIAIQQQEQYKQQANAEEERIAVQEKKARADKQPEVIAAKLSIDIATDNAQARRKQAEGVRDATKTEADGEAYKNVQVGKGIAQAYDAQAEAIGRQNLALIQIMKEIASGNIKITPDMLVTGDGGAGNLFNAFMATILANQGTTPAIATKLKAPKQDVKTNTTPSMASDNVAYENSSSRPSATEEGEYGEDSSSPSSTVSTPSIDIPTDNPIIANKRRPNRERLNRGARYQ
jgi:regulator of protease activity HflC (stomatin/prohibitin superfamily)